MPIHILDPSTVARIAAGEVIERPASVVKELVENALDAGARQVIVETRGGGVGFIRVIDNGHGIPPNEVATAFARHATSKLNRIEDLECLETLGFRGEALPSIAAVAEVEMSTSLGGATGGVLIQLKNGQVVNQTSQARARGTTVTVRNLFRNVPARLKFLKSTATENGHIAAVITLYALAYHEVRFTLLMEEKSVLQTTGTGRLLDAVIAVYGAETARQTVEIAEKFAWQAGEKRNIRVSGIISSPVFSRAGRDGLSFFVNRRAINSRLLTFAVEESYQGLLMQGRHPLAVVNITLPPALVDVNVHPAKSEVKFSDERGVFAVVQQAVKDTLASLAPIPGIGETPRAYQGAQSHRQTSWDLPVPDVSAATPVDITPPRATPSRLPPLRVLGQAASTYIVAEGPEGIYIIDQHAAHERILYETIRDQHAAQNVAVQGLLEAATLEVTPRQEAVLQECAGELSAAGFAIEPFGERNYLVRTVPAVLRETDWLAALHEFLDEPAKRDQERQEAIIKTLACHGAVRAGQTLQETEMRSILRQLEQTGSPFTCPHGRPTLIRLNIPQLEREFGRI